MPQRQIVPPGHPARKPLELALEELSKALNAIDGPLHQLDQDLPKHIDLSIGAAYDQVHALLHTDDEDHTFPNTTGLRIVKH